MLDKNVQTLQLEPFQQGTLDAIGKKLHAIPYENGPPARGISPQEAKQFLDMVVSGAVKAVEKKVNLDYTKWIGEGNCVSVQSAVHKLTTSLPKACVTLVDVLPYTGRVHNSVILRLPIETAPGQCAWKDFLIDPTYLQFFYWGKETGNRLISTAEGKDFGLDLLAHGHAGINEALAERYVRAFDPDFKAAQIEPFGGSFLNLLCDRHVQPARGTNAQAAMPDRPDAPRGRNISSSPSKESLMARLGALQESHRLSIQVFVADPEYPTHVLDGLAENSGDLRKLLAEDKAKIFSQTLLPSLKSGKSVETFASSGSPGYLFDLSNGKTPPALVVRALVSGGGTNMTKGKKKDLFLEPYQRQTRKLDRIYRGHTTESWKRAVAADPSLSGKQLDALGSHYESQKGRGKSILRLNELLVAASQEHIAAIAMPLYVDPKYDRGEGPGEIPELCKRLEGAMVGLGHLRHGMDLPVVIYHVSPPSQGECTYLARGEKEFDDVAADAIRRLQEIPAVRELLNGKAAKDTWEKNFLTLQDRVKQTLGIDMSKSVAASPVDRQVVGGEKNAGNRNAGTLRPPTPLTTFAPLETLRGDPLTMGLLGAPLTTAFTARPATSVIPSVPTAVPPAPPTAKPDKPKYYYVDPDGDRRRRDTTVAGAVFGLLLAVSPNFTNGFNLPVIVDALNPYSDSSAGTPLAAPIDLKLIQKKLDEGKITVAPIEEGSSIELQSYSVSYETGGKDKLVCTAQLSRNEIRRLNEIGDHDGPLTAQELLQRCGMTAGQFMSRLSLNKDPSVLRRFAADMQEPTRVVAGAVRFHPTIDARPETHRS